MIIVFSGPFSAIASCTTPPSGPNAVVVVKTSSTANSVTLIWKEPANNGSEILSYNIDLGEKHLISVGKVLEYTIDDLLPETTYRSVRCAKLTFGRKHTFSNVD